MIYLILATIFFSLSFGLIKSQLAILPSDFVVFCRLFVATLVFLPFIKKMTLTEHLKACLIGIIQFGLMYLCFIKAFKYLQGNEIAILTTTTPIFVALWSILYGERFRLIYIISIILSVFGAVIILYDNVTFSSMIKGILLMESCNCTFALGQVLWKKYLPDNSLNFMASAYLGASLFILPFMIHQVQFFYFKLTTLQILSILYLGIVPTGLGFWLWNKGCGKVSYSMLAVMNNLKIPLGVAFAIMFFGERINVWNFVLGATIILCAIWFLNRYTNCK